MNLKEIARPLITLGLWDEEDASQIQKLYKKRDYVAHKNTKRIQRILSTNKSISVPEIDLAMSKFDVVPFMFITIRLLFKLLDRFILKTERMRVAKALLESRISDELELKMVLSKLRLLPVKHLALVLLSFICILLYNQELK
jgi:hypothetical protein